MTKDAEELRRRLSEAGKRGGAARAKALSQERRHEIAVAARAALVPVGPTPKPEAERLQNVPCRILPRTIQQLNELAETLGEKRGRVLERIIAKEHKRVTKAG
jgi:hypothetical protein